MPFVNSTTRNRFVADFANFTNKVILGDVFHLLFAVNAGFQKSVRVHIYKVYLEKHFRFELFCAQRTFKNFSEMLCLDVMFKAFSKAWFERAQVAFVFFHFFTFSVGFLKMLLFFFLVEEILVAFDKAASNL